MTCKAIFNLIMACLKILILYDDINIGISASRRLCEFVFLNDSSRARKLIANCIQTLVLAEELPVSSRPERQRCYVTNLSVSYGQKSFKSAL